MRRVFFATGNAAKLAQLRFVAEYIDAPVEVQSGREVFGDAAKYDEIGTTVADIASNGALAVARVTGHPVCAEDTSFCVAAWDGKPGVDAKFYQQEKGRVGLLHELADVDDRRASIVSALAYATPEGVVKLFTNRVEGSIAHEERYGDHPEWIAPSADLPAGGGFNAIFIPAREAMEGRSRTLAEIGPEEAIPWSYRERNFIDLLTFLQSA